MRHRRDDAAELGFNVRNRPRRDAKFFAHKLCAGLNDLRLLLARRSVQLGLIQRTSGNASVSAVVAQLAALMEMNWFVPCG